jgi:signal transduction histidine kinase
MLSAFPSAVAAASRRISFRRRGRWPELQPLSLAASRSGWLIAAVFVVVIVFVAGLESRNPGLSSLGSLLFVPVLASAWLLGNQQAATVASLAVVARLIGYLVAGVDLGTAIAEVTALACLAVMTRLAAVALIDRRRRDIDAARDRRSLELLAEREKIAGRVTDTAIRRLFGMSLRLQAALTQSEDDTVGAALRDGIAEADALIVDLRTAIFDRTV